MTSRLIAACAALLLGACAVGPEYAAPRSEIDDGWRDARQDPAPVPERWWSVLDDTTLAELLAAAVAHNREIGIAVQRVAEARAARGVARSVFWPSVGASGSRTRFEQSIESPGAGGALIDAGLIPRDVDFFTTGLDASWEFDLFGGTRRRAEGAQARLEGAVADQAGVVLAVLSETAAAYFELRGAQARLRIAASNIASQERTLELTQRKVEAGLARRIDELRAKAQVEAARARLPALRAAIAAGTQRLAVLTGRYGDELELTARAGAELPAAPELLPVGLRAELLRRRPDVVAAERRLAAATADMGVARADFFPRLVLNASYGFEAEGSGELIGGRARTTAIVPFVSWPVFQGGRLRANFAAADARTQAALLAYEQSVLQALADVETALSAYAEEQAAFERLASAAEASREAATIAQRLYEQGLADFLTVLDAERRRDEADDARAQSQTRLLLNMSRVYKALGGGWEVVAPI